MLVRPEKLPGYEFQLKNYLTQNLYSARRIRDVLLPVCVENISITREKLKEELEELRKKVGPIDYLFTQFGYANWAGNESDNELPKKAKKLVFDTLRSQIEILQPIFVVPFASFVYFSHEENFHWNKNSVKIKEVFKFLSIELNQNVIVPKPGLKIVGITRTQDELPQRNGKPLESLLGENDEALSFWENKFKNSKKLNFKNRKF